MTEHKPSGKPCIRCGSTEIKKRKAYNYSCRVYCAKCNKWRIGEKWDDKLKTETVKASQYIEGGKPEPMMPHQPLKSYLLECEAQEYKRCFDCYPCYVFDAVEGLKKDMEMYRINNRLWKLDSAVLLDEFLELVDKWFREKE